MSPKRNKKNKSKIRINLEYYPAMLLVWIIMAMPLRLAYFLSKMGFRILYIIDIKHRRRTIQHMLHSGIVATRKEAVRLSYKVYEHFGQLLVEIIKMNQLITKDNIMNYVSFNAPDEIIEKVFKKEKSEPVIIVTGHCGNWELSGKAYSMLSGHSLVSIMRPLSNPKLGEFIYRHRENPEHRTVSKEKGLRPLLRALQEGKSIAIVADQHATSSEGVETTFFGHPARSHTTPALLHLKTGVPILAGVMRRTDNKFHFEFRGRKLIRVSPGEDRKADIQKITQMYTSELEALIREAPDQWMWSHRRWLDINRKSKYQEGKIDDDKKVTA
jgi:KDO2-lipid IV(A) lauroyltransferase